MDITRIFMEIFKNLLLKSIYGTPYIHNADK